MPHPSFSSNGFLLIKDFFNQQEISNLTHIVNTFHRGWKDNNEEFYQTKAINSSGLTEGKYINSMQRLALFKFLATNKLVDMVHRILGEPAAFMNTQLFFDPVTIEQKNYWHRDFQYHLSEQEQKIALSGSEVVHFRIPLVDEPGIELISGSHKRWDSNTELAVRTSRNGHLPHNDLANSSVIKLNAGDLLIFSAKMIHRGLYGNDRLAFDAIFFESNPALAKPISNIYLPNKLDLQQLENPTIFKETIRLKL
ncbi:phytanoyl-CoA dioxygenase family protein [Litorilituus lipolyticus]|uniref:Phytanoyl-CoA dioxygenase n=1 Tax=Litorilituus lipolyticus TaxID=2491017 RepID=A0A502KMC7_9GAMM|nr:phytanoyl-CoA dioxygenase family protein [Litorilituus lipolyticus]TPH12800.1 phytanoyl-CoA dioxygenase [Litorilituus lipolyticus]